MVSLLRVLRVLPDVHSEATRPASMLEKAFTVLSLFVFSRALIFHLFAKASGESQPGSDLIEAGANVINQPNLLWLYLGIYCVTGLLVLRQWRAVLYFLYREKFLVLLLLLSALSSLWSLVPMETMAKTVAISACTIFGCYFALRYEPRMQLRLLAWALYLGILASFATALLFPEVGIMKGEHDGLWRGAFLHKNMLGTIAPLGSITLFLLAASTSKYRSFYWTGFWLSLFVLVMSCSKSALLLTGLVFFAAAVYLAASTKYQLATIALLSVGITLSCFYLQYSLKLFPPVALSKLILVLPECVVNHEVGNAKNTGTCLVEKLSSLAPDSAQRATGEGRISLWRLLAEKINQRPWLGYGFGGFWLGMEGPSSDIWKIKLWQPPHAHNGFLDIWLHLGLVGVSLFAMSFCATAYRVMLPLAGGTVSMTELLPPAMLCYIFLANIGESDLFNTNSLLWICFVSTAISARRYIDYPRAASETRGHGY